MESDIVMALFPTDNMKRDGIQLGGPNTLCYKCELERRANDPDSDIPYGKLQYKEVFKITQQGLDTCICMKHFKEMCATSHYMLIDTDECMAVPLSAMEESAPEVEVEDNEVESEVEEVESDKNPEEAPAEEEKPKKKDKKDKKKEDK